MEIELYCTPNAWVEILYRNFFSVPCLWLWIPCNSVLLAYGMFGYVLSVYEFRVHYLHIPREAGTIHGNSNRYGGPLLAAKSGPRGNVFGSQNRSGGPLLGRTDFRVTGRKDFSLLIWIADIPDFNNLHWTWVKEKTAADLIGHLVVFKYAVILKKKQQNKQTKKLGTAGTWRALFTESEPLARSTD